MSKLTLISSHTCPYVQRAIIALKEKGVPFDVEYVDLANKPDWFAAVSPLGKVPVLKVQRPGEPDATVFESSVIVEYLEETAGDKKLHPSDALDRAQHRAWMEYGSTILSDMFKLGTAKDAGEVEKAKEAVAAKFKRLEGVLTDGPFFDGADFSYVDAVFAPVFRQIAALETVTPIGVLDGLPKVAAWAKALLARASVQQAVPADFVDRYLTRLRGMGSDLLKVAA